MQWLFACWRKTRGFEIENDHEQDILLELGQSEYISISDRSTKG